MSHPQRRHAERRLDAFVGFLLGLGAPLGWLATRYIVTQMTEMESWLRHEVSTFGALYAYMGFGSVVVFTVFGYVLGRRSDAMIDESESAKQTLDKVNELAMTDALTGIHNARYLHDQVALELESARRYNSPLTCMMFDIDDFKKINDTYGHPYGDAVLTALARTIHQCVRRIDIVGRLGGEEFLVVMPHTSMEIAFSIAERMRQAIEHWPFAVQDAKISVTVSIGVVCFPDPGIVDKSSFLKAADEALYQAKRTGKNRTVVWKSSGQQKS